MNDKIDKFYLTFQIFLFIVIIELMQGDPRMNSILTNVLLLFALPIYCISYLLHKNRRIKLITYE